MNSHRLLITMLVGLLTGSVASADPYLPPITKGDISVEIETIVTGLGAPNYLAHSGDGTNRLFVVDQIGRIRLIKNGQLVDTPFLDISDRVAIVPSDPFDERGLVGLAFHPGFANPDSPGFLTLYTYSSESTMDLTPDFPAPDDVTDHHNVVTEWRVPTLDSEVVDITTRREIMRIAQPQIHHNAGAIVFSPTDGYLYIAEGDGGGGYDIGPGHSEPNGNAQDTSNILGKIIRIDPLHPSLTSDERGPPSTNGQYRIGADNPFVGSTIDVREIFAFGLRNPFRISFDVDGSLIAADVGQRSIEEIDIITIGGNYGWAFKEGTFLFNRMDGSISEGPDPIPGLINPVAQYDHGDGSAVIGGFMYRGSAIPELVGKYVFGDFFFYPSSPNDSGRLFYADLTTGEINEFIIGIDDRPLGGRLHGFGQDAQNEVYVLVTTGPPNGTDGIVYRLVPRPSPFQFFFASPE